MQKGICKPYQKEKQKDQLNYCLLSYESKTGLKCQ